MRPRFKTRHDAESILVEESRRIRVSKCTPTVMASETASEGAVRDVLRLSSKVAKVWLLGQTVTVEQLPGFANPEAPVRFMQAQQRNALVRVAHLRQPDGRVDGGQPPTGLSLIHI